MTQEQITHNRKKVDSSQILSVGYDVEIGYDVGSKKLEVEFKTGSIYVYDNVEPETHAELMKSDSIGAFFGIRIKDQVEKYPFKKIRPSNRELEKYRKDGFEWNQNLLMYEKQESFL